MTNWERNELYVMESLTRIESKLDDTIKSVNEIKTELAIHKVKTGLFGSLFGIIGAALAKLIWG